MELYTQLPNEMWYIILYWRRCAHIQDIKKIIEYKMSMWYNIHKQLIGEINDQYDFNTGKIPYFGGITTCINNTYFKNTITWREEYNKIIISYYFMGRRRVKEIHGQSGVEICGYS
jgi:hypothetical protein